MCKWIYASSQKCNTSYDIWSYDGNLINDKNSKVIKVSIVRWLQMWLEFLSIIQKMTEVWKTTLPWDRYSIYNKISLIHFQPKLNKEKWQGDKNEHLKNGVNVKTCLSPFCNENIGLQIEIGKSTEEWSTKPMSREECKNVSIIN